MDTEALRTIAAVVGAIGGFGGFTSLVYTVVRDRKIASKEAEALVKTLLTDRDGGKSLQVNFEPRDATERLCVELTCRPTGTLSFQKLTWSVVPGQENALVPEGNESKSIKVEMQDGLRMGKPRADVLLRKLDRFSIPEITIAISVAKTNKIIARTKRHIND